MSLPFQPGYLTGRSDLRFEGNGDTLIASDTTSAGPRNSHFLLEASNRIAIRNKDSEEVVAPENAQSRFGSWRWSTDYAAPVERAPLGWKSGGGPGADSPRFPTRAEGEKRFRSAIRNP